MGHVEKPNFLSPLGLLKFYDFLSFLFILKLSYSKPIRNILNCASVENIETVMKFYNLGDKTWATLFGQLKNWPVIFWPVKLASYFMQMRFEVIDFRFNWLLQFSTFLFRGSLHSMFRLRYVLSIAGSYDLLW